MDQRSAERGSVKAHRTSGSPVRISGTGRRADSPESILRRGLAPPPERKKGSDRLSPTNHRAVAISSRTTADSESHYPYPNRRLQRIVQRWRRISVQVLTQELP